MPEFDVTRFTANTLAAKEFVRIHCNDRTFRCCPACCAFWQQQGFTKNVAYAGDFNGDGKSDIVVSQEDVQQLGGIGHTVGFSIFINNSPVYTSPPINDKTVIGNNHDRVADNFYSSDFNGDRLDDIITLTENSNNQLSQITIFYSNYSNGTYTVNTGANQTTTLQPPSLPHHNGTTYSQINHEDRTMRIGDFDGDGRTDYILYLGDGNNNWMWFISFPAKGIWNQPLYPYGSSISAFSTMLNYTDYIRVLDFDGDGKGDIMITQDVGTFASNHTQIYNIRYDNATSAWYLRDVLYQSNYPSSNHQVYIGDFNGDGKADLLTLDPGNNYQAEVDYSTGTGIIAASNFSLNANFQNSLSCSWCPCASWECGWVIGCRYTDHNFSYLGKQDEIYIGDFDGDGKSDILQYHPSIVDCQNQTFTSFFDVYYSTGTSFHRQNYPWNNAYLADNITWPMRMVADMNGDGKADLTAPTAQSNNLQTLYFDAQSSTYENEKVIEKIEDGMGRVTQFDYTPITQGAFVQSTASNSYPLISVQFPLPVVATLYEANDNGSQNVLTYTYTDAKLHNGGRGFLGFQAVDIHNPALNTTEHSEYTIDPVYYVPWLDTVIKQIGGMQSETINSVSFSGSNGIFTQQLDKVTETTLAGATNTSNYYYDQINNNGDIIQTVVDINGVENSTTNTSYINGSSLVANSYYSKPSNISSTTTRYLQNPVSVTHAYAYNSAELLITDVFTVGSSSPVNTKTYIYDGFGNVISSVTSYNVSPPRICNTAYDSKGRFAVSSNNGLSPTDPLYQGTATTFDPLWGKPSQETGIAGNTTRHQYDEWGRIIQTTPPPPYNTNVLTTTSYNWDINTSTSPNTYWNTYTQTPQHSDLKIWYNQTGKEVKRQTDGYSGILTSTKVYDNAGNVSTETAPYLPSETPIQTSYTYNNLNLLSSSTNFQGTTNYSYIYGNGMATVQSTGPSIPCSNGPASKTCDATGKITSSADDGGTLNFTFDSWGNKTITEHANGAYNIPLVTNQYDPYGRLSRVTNYNSNCTGTSFSSYQYDDRNRVTQETDPNNNIHTYDYDALDRVTNRFGPAPYEGQTHYDYYSAASYNKLQAVNDIFNHRTEAYTYNVFDGTLATKVETYNGNQVNADIFYYDLWGRLEEKQGMWTDIGYFYDNYGNLDRVYDKSSANLKFYQSQAENGLGEPTEYTLGSLTTTKTYSNGQPTQYYTPGVQNLNMTWVTGNLNLLKRTDSIKHTSEDFDYDNMFRLKYSQSSYTNSNNQLVPNPQLNFSYDNHSGTSRGDLEKSDVGMIAANNFNYWVHQLTSIQNPSPYMVANEQNQQNISYTGFRQPVSIIEGNNEMDFTYDASYQRKSSQLLQSGLPVERREYYGDWERIKNTAAQTDYVVNYIGGREGTCALSVIDISGCNISGPITVVINHSRTSNGTITVNGCTVSPVIYYVYKDHLGSFLTITDANGNIAGEQNFDPWGRIRNPADWSYNNTNTNFVAMPSWMIRGYIGQEYLPEFGLINLNARLYDPVVGRMLGPDRYISDPYYTQDYNAYSYAHNNPLKYADPDGNDPLLLVGALFGGIGNWMAHGCQWNAKGLGYFGVGALAGATGGLLGGAVAGAVGIGGAAGGAIGGAVGGTAGGFMLGAGNSWMGGANFGQGLSSGLQGGGLGALGGGMSGGIFGGMYAWSNGGNFWDGNGTGYGEASAEGGHGGAGGHWEEYGYTHRLSEAERYDYYIKSVKAGYFSSVLDEPNDVARFVYDGPSWWEPIVRFFSKFGGNSQGGGYTLTSNYDAPGRRSWHFPTAKKNYGVINIDDILKADPNGEGFYDAIDKVENAYETWTKRDIPKPPFFPGIKVDEHGWIIDWGYNRRDSGLERRISDSLNDLIK